MIEQTDNSPYSATFKCQSDGELLEITASFPPGSKECINVRIYVNGLCGKKANNPVSMLRLILAMCREIERRKVERVEFLSISRYTKYQTQVIESFGWSYTVEDTDFDDKLIVATRPKSDGCSIALVLWVMLFAMAFLLMLWSV